MPVGTYIYKIKGTTEHYDTDPLYAIKKIMQYYKRAEISIEISLDNPNQLLKGQIDFEGKEVA